MAESIFIRVQRVLSAGGDTAVAAAERASGASLMREAIRQIDRAGDEIRAEHDAADSGRLQAQRQQQLLRERLATLDEQARFALSKGRDDLAEAAVSRQIEHETELKRLKKVEIQAADDIARLEQCMRDLKLRKSQMEKELASFQSARNGSARTAAPDPAGRAQRKAERAEEAFERAMSAAGGLGTGLMDGEDAAKLAEVEVLQKEAAIAERLAAMRARQEAGVANAKRRPTPRAKAE